MRALQGRFGNQYAIIGNDPDQYTVDAGKTADQSGAIARLELIEIRAVNQPRNHLVHIIGDAWIGGNHA